MGNRPTKIYTRTGDAGRTALADGKRIDKSSLRIDTIGEVDELNSVLGMLEASGVLAEMGSHFRQVQQRLFDIGGELAIPGSAAISPACVERLEELINGYNDPLPHLKEFILPGGSLLASICHMARTICRRCERLMVTLGQAEYVNPGTLRYMNRLSDLLFVLARALKQLNGGQEVFWDSERLKRSV